MKQLTILIISILAIFSSCNNKPEAGPGFDTTLLSDSQNKSSCVRFASDENDNAVVSWCETDKAEKNFFYLSFFDEEKGKFGGRINIPMEQNTAIHEEGMPKIAIKSDGTIIAMFEVNSPTPDNGWAGFIHYIQSFDKGKSWTQPLCVHADTSAGKSRSFADITRLGNGEIGATWLDAPGGNKEGGRPVKFAKTNGRNGFGNERLVDSLACECCRTAISSNDGKISIVFRDIIDDNIRDISVSTSSDNGETFSPAFSFSDDDWVINGCPHNGPSVVNSKENVYAAWFTGSDKKGVYYSELNNNHEVVFKKLISPNGKNIQLCLMADGSRVLAYNEISRHADSLFSRIIVNKIANGTMLQKDITPSNAQAGYPVIHALKKDKIVVAWTEDDKVFYSIVRSQDISDAVQEPALKPVVAFNDLPKIKIENKKDPVCGMPLGEKVQDTTRYHENIIGFCSDGCKDKFIKKPNAYLVMK